MWGAEDGCGEAEYEDQKFQYQKKKGVGHCSLPPKKENIEKLISLHLFSLSHSSSVTGDSILLLKDFQKTRLPLR